MKFHLDKIFNKIFYKFNNFRIIEKYIYKQEILKNCPENFKKKVFFRIYICRKNKLLISLIPKNANTSIKNFFNHQFQKTSSDNYFYTKLLSNNFKDFTKVIFFREPNSRFLSYYSNKIFQKENDFNFSKFFNDINYLNRVHLLPQSCFILNNLKYYDVIGNVENLEFYINKVLQLKKIKKTYKLQILNSSEENKYKFDIQKFLNKNKKFLYEIYINDFKLWDNIFK